MTPAWGDGYGPSPPSEPKAWCKHCYGNTHIHDARLQNKGYDFHPCPAREPGQGHEFVSYSGLPEEVREKLDWSPHGENYRARSIYEADDE